MDWFAVAALTFVVLTLLVLFAGIAGFARGGAFNRKHGNRLMRMRVAFQFAALVMIGLMFLLMGGT